jgi:hypothetical protein
MNWSKIRNPGYERAVPISERLFMATLLNAIFMLAAWSNPSVGSFILAGVFSLMMYTIVAFGIWDECR